MQLLQKRSASVPRRQLNRVLCHTRAVSADQIPIYVKLSQRVHTSAVNGTWCRERLFQSSKIRTYAVAHVSVCPWSEAEYSCLFNNKSTDSSSLIFLRLFI